MRDMIKKIDYKGTESLENKKQILLKIIWLLESVAEFF